jgi:hypothetical protein
MVGKDILKSLLSRKAPRHPRRNAFKPSLEVLESRQLLSVTSAVFVVEQASSTITLSGDIGGTKVQPQGNGSLSSTYTGSIVAEWDLNALTIHFVKAGTALSATVTGNWQPLPGGGSGSAPAVYGGKVSILFITANLAVRNLVVSGFTADTLTLSEAGPYSFPSTQTITALAGAADYNAGAFGSGSENLSGLSGDNQTPDPGTFEDLGSGSYRVTEPISVTIRVTISGLPTTLHIDGQIVANAVLPMVNLTDGSGSTFDFATSAVGAGGPVAIEDPAATVTRTPPANLTSMTVTLTNHPDDTAEFLAYDLGDSGLSTNGYDATTGQLVITGSADPSVYQNVLRTITYENDSLTPDTSDRQIQFVVSDESNTSVVRTTTVGVSAPASPSPPSGLVLLKDGLPSDRSIMIVDSLKGAVAHTQPNPLLGGPSPGVKAPADELTAALFTMAASCIARRDSMTSGVLGGAVLVPVDRLLALEALAIGQAL